MKYNLTDMDPSSFEDLVIGICQELLGINVKKFSNGPDGGRDARFEGTSTQLGKKGKFIIQVKHTRNPIEKFSDPKFSSNDTAIMVRELPKIRKLIASGELDFYLLFSNRKMSASGEETVRSLIMETGLQSHEIELYGIENIEGYLKKFPKLVTEHNVDLFHNPLFTEPGDLAEVILAFHNKLPQVLNAEPSTDAVDFTTIDLEEKNQLNNVSPDYFNLMKEDSLSTFEEIRKFLMLAHNKTFQGYYIEMAKSLKSTLIAKKRKGDSFDEMLETLYAHLVERDGDLKRHRGLTRIFLHYMYWNCDIGIREDAKA